MNITLIDIKNGIYSQIKCLREQTLEMVRNERTKDAQRILAHIAELEALDAAISKGYGASKYDTKIDGACFASLIRQHVEGAHFFVYDNEGGMIDFESSTKARECAEGVLRDMRDGWNEGGDWGSAKSLCWGIILGRALEVRKDSGGDTAVPFNEWTEYELTEM